MDDVQKFSTLKDSPPAFPVWESKLIARFGVGRERLLEMREAALVCGVDWIKKGRRICLTLEAVAKLEAELQITPGKNGGGAVTARPEPLPKAVFVFKVYGKRVTHPNLLLATDGVNLFRVRVRNKVNFLPGMAIRCEHDRLDLFNHVGNCPRFRGKY